MDLTVNEPAVIDARAFTVRRTITIAAPIEKVWTAITDAEHIARWFPQRAVLDDLAVGAEGTFTWDGYGAFPVRIEALEPPRMIAYRWGDDTTHSVALDPAHSTVFRFTLDAVDGGTRLTVVETGFDTLSDPAAGLESNRDGWNSELDELVAYLESGS